MTEPVSEEAVGETKAWMFKGRDGEPVTLEEKLEQSMEFGSAMERLAVENNAHANALEEELKQLRAQLNNASSTALGWCADVVMLKQENEQLRAIAGLLVTEERPAANGLPTMIKHSYAGFGVVMHSRTGYLLKVECVICDAIKAQEQVE